MEVYTGHQRLNQETETYVTDELLRSADVRAAGPADGAAFCCGPCSAAAAPAVDGGLNACGCVNVAAKQKQ